MKFLVTGCGFIGRRHIQNLLTFDDVEVSAHDVSDEGRALVKKLFDVHVFEDYEDALADSPDAVVVATPTSIHIEPALDAAKAGCHLFIEKPLSHTMDGLSDLLSIVKQKGLITLVGCNMRFHPGIREVKRLLEKGVIGNVLSANIEAGSYLPEWHPDVDYRQNYSARKDLGGGIILDSIHEIDYATWMLGKVEMVACMAEKVSSLDIDVEDVADIVLRFSSNVTGHIHLDYVQRAYSRKCKFIGEEGSITWDFGEGRVGLFSAKEKKWTWFHQPGEYEINQMYLDETNHFINCVKGLETPIHDIFGGYEDLEIALAAKKSALENKFISINNDRNEVEGNEN